MRAPKNQVTAGSRRDRIAPATPGRSAQAASAHTTAAQRAQANALTRRWPSPHAPHSAPHPPPHLPPPLAAHAQVTTAAAPHSPLSHRSPSRTARRRHSSARAPIYARCAVRGRLTSDVDGRQPNLGDHTNSPWELRSAQSLWISDETSSSSSSFIRRILSSAGTRAAPVRYLSSPSHTRSSFTSSFRRRRALAFGENSSR